MKNTVSQAFEPVPFSKVTIEDVFWAPRLHVNREKTIPHIYRMCKETGRIDAYKLDWKVGQEQAPQPGGAADSPFMTWTGTPPSPSSTEPTRSRHMPAATAGARTRPERNIIPTGRWWRRWPAARF